MKLAKNALLILIAFSVELGFAQDRQIHENLVYPPEAFYRNGGPIINVQEPPFNAKGDGITDDTKSLVRAYDTVARIIRDQSWHDDGVPSIYLPGGTYLISNTLIYSLKRLSYDNNSHGGISKVRIIGQDRRNTEIRLQDNAPGFQGPAPKPVVAFHKDHGTNIPGANLIRNITINSGSGNPAAIGLVFTSANTGLIRNVTIRSGDGQGNTGLLFGDFSAQGYFSGIRIEGFDYGIQNERHAANNPACEYITLKNQNKAAIYNEYGATHIRALHSINKVPLLEITGGSVTLVESKAEEGAYDETAIRISRKDALVFVRGVSLSGYGAAISVEDKVVHRGDIEEYVSLEKTMLFPSPERSMNLPVATAPEVPWFEDFSKWACVEDYPGANDHERIQNALNSGKPVVYFTKRFYDINRRDAFTVPASVQRIDMMFAEVLPTYTVEEYSDQPLLFENCQRAHVRTSCSRTIIKRISSGSFSNTNNSKAVMFLESGAGIGAGPDFCPPNQLIFARGINNENKQKPCFEVNGGVMWCLGYKTEGWQPAFYVYKQGVCEALGGYRNQTHHDEGNPQLLITHGNISHTGYTSMAATYEQIIWEKQYGSMKKLTRTAFPDRVGGWDQNIYIPLYNGWRADEVKAAEIKIRLQAGMYLLQ